MHRMVMALESFCNPKNMNAKEIRVRESRDERDNHDFFTIAILITLYVALGAREGQPPSPHVTVPGY